MQGKNDKLDFIKIKPFSINTLKMMKRQAITRAQSQSPQDMPLWHADNFKRKQGRTFDLLISQNNLDKGPTPGIQWSSQITTVKQEIQVVNREECSKVGLLKIRIYIPLFQYGPEDQKTFVYQTFTLFYFPMNCFPSC